MTTPKTYTDPTTGQRYLWSEEHAAWQLLPDAPPGHQAPPPPNPGVPSRSVSKTRRHTSHGLHLFLTIVTLGMWGLFVWLPITLWHKFGPRRRTVTQY